MELLIIPLVVFALAMAYYAGKYDGALGAAWEALGDDYLTDEARKHLRNLIRQATEELPYRPWPPGVAALAWAEGMLKEGGEG